MLEDRDDVARGTPMVRASIAAREKFSRDMIDITVDARHKFDAFRSTEVGAISGAFFGSSGRSPGGIRDTAAKIAGTKNYWAKRVGVQHQEVSKRLTVRFSPNRRLHSKLNTRTPKT